MRIANRNYWENDSLEQVIDTIYDLNIWRKRGLMNKIYKVKRICC